MAILHNVYLLLAILIGKSIAQDTPSDVCTWTQLRAAMVRDALYVNGGFLTTTAEATDDSGINGAIYVFNFSQSFETTNKNFSAFFTQLPAQGPMADYWDGTIFATDEKIYLYGGMLPIGQLDKGLGTPPGHVIGYQLYPTDSLGLLNETLNVSSNITDGAGVNIPSESLGFYFSGMEAPGGIQVVGDGNIINTPSVAAESFIQVNMSSVQETQWSNLTWPAEVKPRANAQLVWLPVSSQGVLIVIGGVVDPQDLLYGGGYDNASQIADSQSTSPGFMTSLPVYDIGNQQWFVQDASGDVPGQLTEFCSVVAQADGSSTSEIYIYGGYDGLNGSSRGDVWVLSVPAFVWIHAYDPGSGPNDSTHARDSHACVKPYPDQMLVIGGGNTNADCINGIFDVFNLSSLAWLDKYDPTIWADYTIPSIVAGNISATPTATSMNPSLSAILGTKYQKNISTYYPYPPLPVPSLSSGSKLLPAVLGAVLGGVGLLFILVAIWWFLHNRSRKRVTSEGQSSGRTGSWVNGVSTKPDPSVATTEVEDAASPPLAGYYEVQGDWKYHNGASEIEAAVTHRPATPQPVHARADGTGVYEMHGTNALPASPRSVHVEAGGTGRHEMHGTNTLPARPRSVHVEADGIERYEMHALERGSSDTPAEVVASYRFRDHSLYPRDPEGLSQTMSPTLGARSTTSHDASSPSPYVLPQRLIEADYAISHLTASSPQQSSPDQSPPIPSTVEHGPSHRRDISFMSSGLPISTPTNSRSPDLDAVEAASGLGYSNSGPGHTRNISSISSGITQLSPTQQVRAEEDYRLPPPSPASPPMTQAEPTTVGTATQEGSISPVNYQTLHNTRAVARKQVPGRSAFKEEGFESPEPPTL